MRSPLKVFWWQGGGGAGNFGDQLSPLICELVSGRPVVHAEPEMADVIALGSLLEPFFWKDDANLRFSGTIWGTGRMSGDKRLQFPCARIAALRGHLTRNSMDAATSKGCVLGDPGLLAPLLNLQSSLNANRFLLGVVPHWTERQYPLIHELGKLSSEILLIDPTAPVRNVIYSIASCQRILSSGLHGLIVADAFGIPNERLKLQLGHEQQRGLSEFKFQDYDSIWPERHRQPVELSGQLSLDELIERCSFSPPKAELVQKQLIGAFEDF